MDNKLVFLLCIFLKNGIEGARTLIRQSSKYRVTNGQSTSLLLRCAASAGDTDYGHKVNMGSGECSAGDSSNPETGFTYFDKTDMLQLFLNGVSIILYSLYISSKVQHHLFFLFEQPYFCVWFDSLRPINNLTVKQGRSSWVEPVLS